MPASTLFNCIVLHDISRCIIYIKKHYAEWKLTEEIVFVYIYNIIPITFLHTIIRICLKRNK